MITNFIPKDQERGVEYAAIRNNEMRLQIPPHLVLRLEPLKRGTKTKPGEGDINRKEGRRNQYQCRRKMQEPKTKAEEIPRQM